MKDKAASSDSEEEVGKIFGRPQTVCPVRIFLKTIDNFWQLDTNKMEEKIAIMTHLPSLVRPRSQQPQANSRQNASTIAQKTNSFGLTIPQPQRRREANKTANDIIGKV